MYIIKAVLYRKFYVKFPHIKSEKNIEKWKIRLKKEQNQEKFCFLSKSNFKNIQR